MQILKPFGPSIAKINIPDQIVSNMNKYVEEIIIDKKKSEELDFGKNLAGNVQQEFRLDLEFMKENNWAEFLGNSCVEWLSSGHNISVKKFEIISSWIVRQFKNEYNPIHYHGGDISGVGYLKVPKGMTKNKFLKNKKDKTNGTIDFINGQRGFLSKSIYNIVPKERDLIIFPNYLMHTAYPFNINAERRSFSFNAKIIFKK